MKAPGPSLTVERLADDLSSSGADKRPGGLRMRVVRGTIVNAGFNIGLNTLNLLKGFIAAAFLTQTDYGVWGFLIASLSTLAWLKQVGVGDKYIQQEEGDQELAFQKAFTLELILTGLFTCLVLVAVPLLAWFASDSSLLLPGFALALWFPALFLQSPLWVFYRRMDFVKQRSLQAVDPICGAVVTIGLAVAGAGFWSLIGGLLAGGWLGAIVAIRASPYRLTLRYDHGTMRQYASFSGPLFVAALTSMVLPQGSVLVGEKTVGLAGVGAMTLAVTISQFAQRVDDIVTTTIYPAICTVKDRTDLLFESFVKSNRLALMWGVPFGVGVALFAPDLVAYGIGDRWEPAITVIQAFALIAAADQLGFNWDAYFRARGQTKPIAVISVVAMLSFLVVSVPLLISNGLDGFALGMGVVTLATLITRSVYLTRLFSGFTMLRHAARAISPTVPAVVAVLLMRAVEPGRTLVLAIAELAAYLVITAVVTFFAERALIGELLGYLRARAGSAASGPVAIDDAGRSA